MKIILVLLFCFIQTEFSFGQEILLSDTLVPKNSIGVNFLIPQITFQHPLKRNIFFNAGILYPTFEREGTPANSVTVKSGITIKWQCTKKIFFTPSFDLYEYHVFEKATVYQNQYLTSYSINNVLSAGFAVEFEFNPNKRFSFTLGLSEVSLGIASGQKILGSIFQIHNIPFSLGLRLNFNK